jgi:hypothetical protein
LNTHAWLKPLQDMGIGLDRKGGTKMKLGLKDKVAMITGASRVYAETKMGTDNQHLLHFRQTAGGAGGL